MSGFIYYTQIQYLTVMYNHSNSVTYIGSCKHKKNIIAGYEHIKSS